MSINRQNMIEDEYAPETGPISDLQSRALAEKTTNSPVDTLWQMISIPPERPSHLESAEILCQIS